MIISRTPFRISLAGGGTDFPFYYKKYGGKVVGFAIDKYCNIFYRDGNHLMDYNYRIAYSRIELVKKLNDIQHPSVRNTSKYFHITHPFDLLHNGDLPAKTGLGSSSSFTVGMCRIYRHLKKIRCSPYLLSNDAIHIEQKLIKESVGSQDQIFASFGGFNTIKFGKDGFNVVQHYLSDAKLEQINKSFLLMYTGMTRYAEKIEKSKIQNINRNLEYYKKIKSLADSLDSEMKTSKKINLKNVGEILDYGWSLKRQIGDGVSNSKLDELYKFAKKNGAYGGKILGAGGGGFYLFIVDEKKVKNFKKKFSKYQFIDINVSTKGSQIISCD